MKRCFILLLAVTILALVCCSAALGSVLISEQNFPDEYFREYISNNIDKDGNGMLSRQEIEDTTEIDVTNTWWISSLEGIEYFTELKKLICSSPYYSNGDIEELDLSNNLKLEYLDCSGNRLTELDLISNYYLKYLDCSNNQLSYIEVRYNPDLELYYSGNEADCYVEDGYIMVITDIDEENFPDSEFRNFISTLCDWDEDGLLTDEECYSIKSINLASASNSISSLQGIEYFVELQELWCDGKSLTSLDLSNNTELCSLDCSNNQLTTLDIKNNRKLIYSDYSGNNNLTNIYMPYNQVVAVNAENFPDAIFRAYVLSNFDENGDRWLGDGEIADAREIEIHGDEDNWYLGLRDKSNYVSSLKGIEYLSALEYLDCSLNLLTSLNMSSNKELTYLNCGCNLITDLNVSGNYRLHVLLCYANNLTSLDVTKNVQLVSLYCGDNHPYSLETNPVMTHKLDVRVKDKPDGGFSVTTYGSSSSTVYYIPPVSELYTYSNSIAELDLSHNYALHILSCNNMKLKALNLSNNYSLVGLYCSNNEIEELNLSENIGLRVLSCYGNKIKKLDLSNHEELVALGCSNNNLKTINLKNNPSIWVLHCSNNMLRELDLSNLNLNTLGCSGNFLTTLDVRHMGTKLSGLYCYSNDLTELDISQNTDLTVLSCARNKLKTLDVSKHEKLRSLLCSRNQIEELNLCVIDQTDDDFGWTNDLGLQELYCYDNRIRKLDISTHTDLRRFSCTNNLLSEIDISNKPKLEALDCGGNYLVTLDVSHNPELEELYFSGTTLRSVDISFNTALVSLDCVSTDVLTLDISANPSLDAVGCYGNSRLEALYITSTDNEAYPYTTDLREYVGSTFNRITGVKAYDKHDTPINISFSSGQDKVLFAQLPNYIVYDYNIGYAGTASEDAVPRTMSVRMGLPSHSFTYLPKIEAKVISVDSKVVSVDEAISFHATAQDSSRTDSREQSSTEEREDGIYKFSDDSEEFYVAPNEAQGTSVSSDNTVSSGGSGSGCDSGLGMFTAAVFLIFAMAGRRRMDLLVFSLTLAVLSSSPVNAQEQLNASDYTLPTEYQIYDIAGTYTTNFTLTQSQRETIANFAGIEDEKVHTFNEVALSETWKLLPQDFYNLAKSGEYGGVVLPVIRNAGLKDKYVILCTFSNDVMPGELLTVHGFEVDPATMEAIYSEGKDYLAEFITMDDNFNRIERVPENRRVYLAISFTPQYVNTGILGVIRGRYIEEEDPLDRLGDDVAKRIADNLGIDPSELKYLTRANIGRPVPPTEAMKEFVSNDNHEIVVNLPTISVDEAGRYVVPITLSGDAWETLKGKNTEDYKTYALNDSDLGDGQMQPAFINGLLGLWELYTLKGDKMKTFGVKEFLLVGFLDSGKPFSLYFAQAIVKTALALITGGLGVGGCSLTAGRIMIMGLLLLKFLRHR